MEFSRQEYWSRLLFPNPDRPNPGIESESFVLPALAGRFFTTSAIWEAHIMVIYLEKRKSTFLYYPTKYSAYLYVSVYLETKMYHLFYNFISLFLFIGCAGSLLLSGLSSSCSKWELLFIAVKPSHCSGFSCCGAPDLGTQASVVVVPRL